MKNNKSPAFQFYPQDWLSSPRITMMSLEEQGAYLRLLCYDWSNDGIPEDEESFLSLSTLKVSSTKVRECFIPHSKKLGFITNKRLQEERGKQDKWKKKCSDAGKKSALKRSKAASKPTLKVSSNLVATKEQQTGNSSFSSSSSSSSSSNNPPSPPEGEPKKVKKPRLTKEQKKRLKVEFNTPLMIRIGKWFNRKESSLWYIYEAEALEQLGEVDPIDIKRLESFYTEPLAANEERYARRNIPTLLNNWGGEIDKANQWIAQAPVTNASDGGGVSEHGI